MSIQTAIFVVWGFSLTIGLLLYYSTEHDLLIAVIPAGGTALLATALLLLGGL